MNTAIQVLPQKSDILVGRTQVLTNQHYAIPHSNEGFEGKNKTGSQGEK